MEGALSPTLIPSTMATTDIERSEAEARRQGFVVYGDSPASSLAAFAASPVPRARGGGGVWSCLLAALCGAAMFDLVC